MELPANYTEELLCCVLWMDFVVMVVRRLVVYIYMLLLAFEITTDGLLEDMLIINNMMKS